MIRVLALLLVLLASFSARAEDEAPISREALNAIMKHPTEPVYDPLRPMSGRWVICQGLVTQTKPAGTPCVVPGCTPNLPSPEPKARQDRYSSTDRSHFMHTVAFASDSECKTMISEERTTYECSVIDKKNLNCKVTKREARQDISLPGGAKPAWLAMPVAPAEPALRLSFGGIDSAKNKKRKVSDKLTLQLTPESGELQTTVLEFAPSTPRASKSND